MTIEAGALAILAVATGVFSYAESAETSVRMLHVARFIGALLVATLVPFLIDRRLRR